MIRNAITLTDFEIVRDRFWETTAQITGSIAGSIVSSLNSASVFGSGLTSRVTRRDKA